MYTHNNELVMFPHSTMIFSHSASGHITVYFN